MFNITATRQIQANCTASGTWVQAVSLATGAAYSVPSTGRSTVNVIRVSNLGVNSVVIDLAISTDSTIDDIEKLTAPITIAAGDYYRIPDISILPALHGLWIRATGTDPNVVLSAPCLEYLLGIDPEDFRGPEGPAGAAGINDYILVRNTTTGTVWKLERVGPDDDNTITSWTIVP